MQRLDTSCLRISFSSAPSTLAHTHTRRHYLKSLDSSRTRRADITCEAKGGPRQNNKKPKAPPPDPAEFALDGPGYEFNDDEVAYLDFTQDPEGHKAGFIGIIGRPNAGKSTLMNAILGQSLSIVTEKAQTTRHRVLGIFSDENHQAVFLDTPGIIMDKKDELEERMMASVSQAVKDSDALLAIVDAADRPKQALAMLQPGADWKGPPMAIILNKCDLLDPEELEDLQQWFEDNARTDAVICASASQGTNLEVINKWVMDRLPEGPSMYPKDVISEAPERFFVSEIIRRHVFLQYRQEVPYGVAVAVTEFKERRPPAKDLIRASIIVDKDRHRGIIIGAEGAGIKKLSMASRVEIEEFLDRPVFLDVSVKVQEGWRKDAKSLEQLGYS